ncbi:conjugal transfer protein TraN [Serratia sp. UGAL515B_01]|uniref:conjugal transfer protein TraN n=1 Tax=Serratia sp. UGAL515B_01 TaxID=2986763 RepID=UPI00398710FE
MTTRRLPPIMPLFLGILAMPLSSANELDNAMKEGQNVGSSALNSGIDATKRFKPQNEFKDFTSSPPESGYYEGGTQTSTNLGDKGNSALGTSDIGKTISESFINNPADKIDWNSDIIQNSNTIRDNADVIVAGTSPRCVRQELSKVSFSNHSCKKGKDIAATCTKTGEVSWRLEESVEIKNIEYEISSQPTIKSNGTITTTITPNITGEIVSASYSWDIGNSITRNGGVNINILGNSIYKNFGETVHNVMFIPIPSYLTAGVPFYSTHPDNIRINNWKVEFNGHTQLRISFSVKVKVQNWQPFISWTENCPIEKSNAIKLKEWCSQPGMTKIVEREGRSYPLYSDCWQYSEEWQVSEEDDNTCLVWEKEKNCTVGTRQCTEYIGNYCVKEDITYQCQHTVKSEGWLCGEQFYCSDGKCAGMQENSNGDFGDAISKLAAVAAAGKDVADLNSSMVKAFTVRQCRAERRQQVLVTAVRVVDGDKVSDWLTVTAKRCRLGKLKRSF